MQGIWCLPRPQAGYPQSRRVTCSLSAFLSYWGHSQSIRASPRQVAAQSVQFQRGLIVQTSTMDNGSAQGNKLYVGGIPYRSTEDDMKKAFGEAGTVTSASIISDRMTGRSRGFGFVEMASPAEAQAAIDRWDGKELDGRTLSVSFARPQGDRPPRRDGSGYGDRGGYGGGDRGGYGGGY